MNGWLHALKAGFGLQKQTKRPPISHIDFQEKKKQLEAATAAALDRQERTGTSVALSTDSEKRSCHRQLADS